MTPRFELAAPTRRQTAHCSCSIDSTTRHRSPRASTSVPADSRGCDSCDICTPRVCSSCRVPADRGAIRSARVRGMRPNSAGRLPVFDARRLSGPVPDAREGAGVYWPTVRRRNGSSEMVCGVRPAAAVLAACRTGTGACRIALHGRGDAEAPAGVGPQPVAGRPARGLRGHRREPREEQPCQPHLARAGRGRRTRVDRPVRQGRGHAALVAGRQAAGVRLDPRRQFADLDGRHGPERPCRRAEEDHQPRHRGVGHRLVARRQVAGVRVGRLPGVRDERVQRGGVEEVRRPEQQGAGLRRPDVPSLGVVEGGSLQPPLPGPVRRVGGAARRDARRGGRPPVLFGRSRPTTRSHPTRRSSRSRARPTRSRRSARTATCSCWT